jgi:hypothetical protein
VHCVHSPLCTRCISVMHQVHLRYVPGVFQQCTVCTLSRHLSKQVIKAPYLRINQYGKVKTKRQEFED